MIVANAQQTVLMPIGAREFENNKNATTDPNRKPNIFKLITGASIKNNPLFWRENLFIHSVSNPISEKAFIKSRHTWSTPNAAT
jgi:hypothetical protein